MADSLESSGVGALVRDRVSELFVELSEIDVTDAELSAAADLAGQAAGLLEAATQSPEAVVEHLATLIDQLRVACFCTGSRDLAALRRAPLQSG